MLNEHICRFLTKAFYVMQKCIPHTIATTKGFMYVYSDALILTFLLILILIHHQVNFNLVRGTSFLYNFKLQKSRKFNMISANGKSIHLVYVIIMRSFSLTTVVLVIFCVHACFLMMYDL